MHLAMEDMILRKQAFISNNSTPSLNPLAIHKDSRSISKVKPKIRIIHIFAPEIIKTDVANFRELVQRLTGKPENNTGPHRKEAPASGKRKSRKLPRADQEAEPTAVRKIEQMNINNNGVSSQDYYPFGFSDIDGFIQDISELPLLPVDAPHHGHVHSF